MGTLSLLGSGVSKGFYAGMPDVISASDPRGMTSSVVFAANQMRTSRATCHRAGDIRDVSVYVVITSGNIALAIYDTGDANPGNRHLLWSSGSVAMGGAGAWQTIDPGAGVVPVTAGKIIELCVVADNAVASIARLPTVASAMNQLPTGMAVAPGGGLAKLSGIVATAFPPPTDIPEANISANNTVPGVIARIN